MLLVNITGDINVVARPDTLALVEDIKFHHIIKLISGWSSPAHLKSVTSENPQNPLITLSVCT